MKKTYSKSFFLVLIILLFLLCSAISASADNSPEYSGKCEDSIEWKLKGDILIFSGSGIIGEGTANLLKQTPVFKNSTIKKIIIEDGITEIDGSFSNLVNLEEIEMPDSLTSIGDNSFCGCKSLSKITFSRLLVKIGNSAFENCFSLEKLSLPDSTHEIYPNAFKNCRNLKSVVLPKTIQTIPLYLFSGCENLEKISLPDSVLKISGGAFEKCTSLKDVSISKNVSEISFSCFAWCPSVNVKISSKNNYYYQNGKLIYSSDKKTLLFSNGEKEIPSGTEKIGEYAYMTNANVKKITVPSSVKEIGTRAFAYCSNLSEIKLYNGTAFLGNECFANCSALKYVSLPETVIKIGDKAFSYCYSLEKIKLPPYLTEINNGLFESCAKLKNVSLPENLVTIGVNTFKNCVMLEKAEIPDKVTTMANCFSNCTSLKTMNIPSGVDTFSLSDLSDCASLQRIIVEGNTEITNEIKSISGFDSISNNIVFVGPERSKVKEFAEKNKFKFEIISENDRVSNEEQDDYDEIRTEPEIKNENGKRNVLIVFFSITVVFSSIGAVSYLRKKK